MAPSTPFLLLPLLLAACADPGPVIVPPDDSDDTGTPADDTSPEASDDDTDRDGFSVAEGDCDDADVRVSPAREEDPDDGVDNDCDARVDEAFAGVTVGLVTAWPTLTSGGSGDLLRIDSVGRLSDSIALTGCAPLWIDTLGDGWVVNCEQSRILRVDADGSTTVLLDADLHFAERPSFGLWGAAADRDGSVYVSTIDSLVRVSPEGMVSVVATWVVALDDPDTHEFAASAVAVDWVTGEVGLFDYFGGFATWSPPVVTAQGGVAPIAILASGDLENPALLTFTGTHSDRGDWVTPAIDAATGRTGLYTWDDAQGAWVSIASWSAENSEWEPVALAIDGGTGDAYVTANGGWYSTVWRVLDGGTTAHDLYEYGGTSADTSFWGVVVQQ